MSLVSARGRYGLAACLALASEHGPGPMRGATIAERRGIPPRFLPVILHRLKSAGLVQTTRGRSGGYRLARPPSAITALEVIEALDGKVRILPEGTERGLTGGFLASLEARILSELSLSLAAILERHGPSASAMFHI